MALTKGDWSVAANGNIREVAGTSQHEVIEMHRWLMDLLDDTSATGDDLVDVSNGIIPSARSTDNIIALNTPYNIDATVSERFYNGSISYNDGDDLLGPARGWLGFWHNPSANHSGQRAAYELLGHRPQRRAGGIYPASNHAENQDGRR